MPAAATPQVLPQAPLSPANALLGHKPAEHMSPRQGTITFFPGFVKSALGGWVGLSGTSVGSAEKIERQLSKIFRLSLRSAVVPKVLCEYGCIDTKGFAEIY